MPDYSRVHYNYGQVLLVLNRPKEAEGALQKALVLEPQNQEFFVALAQFYLKTGRPDKARALATETLRRVPDHVAATDLLRHLGE
jgi:predicted Zn-dependent protease